MVMSRSHIAHQSGHKDINFLMHRHRVLNSPHQPPFFFSFFVLFLAPGIKKIFKHIYGQFPQLKCTEGLNLMLPTAFQPPPPVDLQPQDSHSRKLSYRSLCFQKSPGRLSPSASRS